MNNYEDMSKGDLLAEPERLLAARKERKMGDYKLVPFEPTPEMIEAAEEAHMPFGDMDLALRLAILAAPAVQGEPVAYMFADDLGRTKIVLGKETAEHWVPTGETIEPLYTAPHPAPDVAQLAEALEQVIKAAPSGGPLWHGSEQIVEAREALAAYRKGGDV